MNITEEELTTRLEKQKQEILLLIPAIVVKHIQDQHEYKKLVDDFYKANPELIKERLLIQKLTNQIAANDPALSVKEVFEETAKQAKEVLKNNEKL